jgi:hypothetical protein
MNAQGVWAKLKPCPKCKGTNIRPATVLMSRLPLVRLYWVKCEDCGYKGDAGASSSQAAERWNAVPRNTFDETSYTRKELAFGELVGDGKDVVFPDLSRDWGRATVIDG